MSSSAVVPLVSATDAPCRFISTMLRALAVAALAAAWSVPVLAQEADRPVLPSAPDFLFREPRGDVGVRLG